MDWLTVSVEQFSVAWIVVSAFLGGVLGSLARFVFEDVLRPSLGSRRETRRLLRRYTTPLLRSTVSLERQINNVVRNADRGWYQSSDTTD